jgi:hypothetical protein
MRFGRIDIVKKAAPELSVLGGRRIGCGLDSRHQLPGRDDLSQDSRECGGRHCACEKATTIHIDLLLLTCGFSRMGIPASFHVAGLLSSLGMCIVLPQP